MIQSRDTNETHESNQSLWLLTASPTIWSVHFLACYVTAAVWCEKFAGAEQSLNGVRTAILVYTLLALIGIGIIGMTGFRRHRFGDSTTPHDFDTPEDRHRFLGFATLLLSALSAVATLFVALAALFIKTCH